MNDEFTRNASNICTNKYKVFYGTSVNIVHA